MLGPFATTSRLTPIQQMSLAVLSCAACASMSTTTTTRDRGDRYGPNNQCCMYLLLICHVSVGMKDNSSCDLVAKIMDFHNKKLFKLKSYLDLQMYCFTVYVVSK